MVCLHVTCFPCLFVSLIEQDEDQKKMEDELANIATIQCANLNGDVMIPIDARKVGNKYAAEPEISRTDFDFSDNRLNSSFGFEPSTTDRMEQSFRFDSSEVLRRARIYAAQEIYKEKKRAVQEREEASSPAPSIMPDIEPVSGAMANGLPFQSYNTNNNHHKDKSKDLKAPDLCVQDLECSKSEYNLKDRMEVEVRLHDEKDVFGYRPHIPSIKEEIEREASPVPRLSLDECITQRDIDLNLPNTMRSARNESEGTEMKEFSARTNRKPESILKDRRNSRDSPIDKISESALDNTDNPSTQHTSKKRIRFQDEK